MDNFCPAPWMSMFCQIDRISVCCANGDNLKMSPNEFRSSDYLSNLKAQFLAGEKPKSCNGCWTREQANLISIRSHYKNNFPKYTREFFNEHTELPVEHMELRTSNLCNFQCRMCHPKNSVEIAREFEDNTELQKYFKPQPSYIMETTPEDWSEIFDISLETKRLFLTGGEPLLIKQYYDLLDHLILNNRCETTVLDIYTNCSVYNPKFMDRISQFKRVKFNLSIDAVGKVAEYQRYGTVWNTVEENALKFCSFPNIFPAIQTTMTAYAVLGISSLADFYLQMLEKNSKMQFMVHVAYNPKGINHMNLPIALKEQAIEQINLAVSKLTAKPFDTVRGEFQSIKKQLLNNTDTDVDFIHLTKTYDQSRNQKFEDVFNFKLY